MDLRSRPTSVSTVFFFFLLETESSLIVQNKLDRSYIKAQPSEARNNVTVQACRNYNSRMHSEQLIKMQTGEEELTWHCCWRRSWLDWLYLWFSSIYICFTSLFIAAMILPVLLASSSWAARLLRKPKRTLRVLVVSIYENHRFVALKCRIRSLKFLFRDPLGALFFHSRTPSTVNKFKA